jgi:hypothetical protein
LEGQGFHDEAEVTIDQGALGFRMGQNFLGIRSRKAHCPHPIMPVLMTIINQGESDFARATLITVIFLVVVIVVGCLASRR